MLDSFPGGKGLLFRHHINRIPPHKVFVSLFAGHCAVAENKAPAELNILLDLDEDVLAAWEQHIVSSGGGAASRDVMERWHYPIFFGDDRVFKWRGAVWVLSLYDALIFLDKERPFPDWFVYADPPYLRSVRSWKQKLYKHEFWTEREHRKLINGLKLLSCKTMLCGYPSPLYDELLIDWQSASFNAQCRSGETREDWIWINYQQPLVLHDYQWLGDDFRNRERIKRKAQRWVNRFEKLPILERQAIIGQLKQAGIL